MRPMSPVVPTADSAEVVYAQNQPPYQPLPCLRTVDGMILTRWSLSEDEKQQVCEQGYIYLSVQTFNSPLQPLLMSADVPPGFDLKPLEEWPQEIDA